MSDSVELRKWALTQALIFGGQDGFVERAQIILGFLTTDLVTSWRVPLDTPIRDFFNSLKYADLPAADKSKFTIAHRIFVGDGAPLPCETVRDLVNAFESGKAQYQPDISHKTLRWLWDHLSTHTYSRRGV